MYLQYVLNFYTYITMIHKGGEDTYTIYAKTQNQSYFRFDRREMRLVFCFYIKLSVGQVTNVLI